MSKVWFAPVANDDNTESIQKKVVKLFEESTEDMNLIEEGDFVALKIHFGEENNTGYVKPGYLHEFIDNLKKKNCKPFFADTNTLYTGQRANSIDHLNQAYNHGFNPENVGIPVIIADGLLSKNYSTVGIAGDHFDEVNIVNDFLHSDTLIGITHFTGHSPAGMGGSIKNMGMGCASRSGKQQQHADVSPTISVEKCVGCGECVRWCPVAAIEIVEGKAEIDSETCYGCAECITTCRYGAISIDWGGSNKALQEKIAEYALGAYQDKKEKSIFFNFLIHITADCDCVGRAQDRIIEDIGILASPDPLAIDQASVDLINEKAQGDLLIDVWEEDGLEYYTQLKHGEKMGLGSREYDLIELGD